MTSTLWGAMMFCREDAALLQRLYLLVHRICRGSSLLRLCIDVPADKICDWHPQT